MSLIPKITELAKKGINAGINKVQEYNTPKPVIKPDEHRIERELAYVKRIKRTNPRLKTLADRRVKVQKRRSL
jgi:hypothetical protein